jgi:hypothetical protein
MVSMASLCSVIAFCQELSYNSYLNCHVVLHPKLFFSLDELAIEVHSAKVNCRLQRSDLLLSSHIIEVKVGVHEGRSYILSLWPTHFIKII